MFLFQDYGPYGAYPSQSKLWAPPTHGSAWAQTVLKQKHII